jgi:membrane protein required for colicin V production
MNWLDVIIIVLIIVPAFIGFRAGIIKALFIAAGVIVGVVLAGRLSGSLGGALTFISNPDIARVVAFAFILVVVMIAAMVAARLVKWAVSAVLLGWVNRLGGIILGIILGMIFCGAVLSIWVKYLGISSPVEESFLAGVLLNGFPVVLKLLPSEFDSVRSFFR